jgi:hemerythrin
LPAWSLKSQSGISAKEIDRLIENLKANAPGHFSDENLKKVEEELRRKL